MVVSNIVFNTGIRSHLGTTPLSHVPTQGYLNQVGMFHLLLNVGINPVNKPSSSVNG